MRPAPGFGRARAGRQGFTLLELLMVLGALAVVLGVLLPGTGMIRTGRIQAIVQDVGTLRHAADRWIERGRLDYAGITVTALKNEGLLPGGWAATNPYGGPYAVAGRAVIVHANPDDFSQPSGNAGGRIACGVITPGG